MIKKDELVVQRGMLVTPEVKERLHQAVLRVIGIAPTPDRLGIKIGDLELLDDEADRHG